MIIGVNGYGYSGSGAVIDLLKEYKNLQVFDRCEFQWLHQPDGVFDLEYQIVENKGRQNSNAALQRFIRNSHTRPAFALQLASKGQFHKISKEYIRNLTLLEWKGYCTYEPYDIYRGHGNIISTFFDKAVTEVVCKVFPSFQLPLKRKTYFSMVDKGVFNKYTKQYLMKIFECLGYNLDRPLVVDQLFSATRPSKGMEYFKKAKSIVVVRDPRDIFIDPKTTGRKCNFMPCNTVDNFILYYQKMHEEIDKYKKNGEVLIISFEDLVLKYKDTIKKIENYLGIRSDDHIFVKKYFNPDISCKNVGRYINFPEYKEDIKKIENSLSSWLYEIE